MGVNNQDGAFNPGEMLERKVSDLSQLLETGHMVTSLDPRVFEEGRWSPRPAHPILTWRWSLSRCSGPRVSYQIRATGKAGVKG